MKEGPAKAGQNEPYLKGCSTHGQPPTAIQLLPKGKVLSNRHFLDKTTVSKIVEKHLGKLKNGLRHATARHNNLCNILVLLLLDPTTNIFRPSAPCY